MLIPVILSGGSGTRLWPMSRELYPKQFLPLDGTHTTLFQSTLGRLKGLRDLAPPIVVANAEHRFLAAEQLLEAEVEAATIFLEPEGRNTAPALAVAALAAIERDRESLVLALPADHAIRDVGQFRSAVETGIDAAGAGHLVVFGVTPTAPETGYGYIRAEAGGKRKWRPVAEFVEKPDARRAQQFVESGNYYWNSGMFLMRADRYLEELELHAPDVASAVRESHAHVCRDCDFMRLEPGAFSRSPSISIDYAVMEHTRRAVVVPLDAGWSDVGSWSSLAEIGSADKAGNVAIGDTLLEDTENTYIRAQSRLIATLGIKNQIVVETPDAVLIADRGRSQDVKRLVNRLAEEGRTEGLMHRRMHRPWGWYEGMVSGERFQVKHICVKPGASLSLQKHHHRAEHWTIVCGTAEVTRGEEQFLLSEDQSTYIPIGTKHRLHNPGTIPLELVEVQTGSYLGEDDIVRYDDNYGRSD
ncbi:MAG: mannose-1-phosphate guanylyltransferase/mannose-6-phosphate isomerase [Gammaproteobacteria bacterium]|nr:mannose-1-phosphate guanylyltransferase/mannose-6-phosphate isomerase [Gammaproteobacteria bacterium]